MSPDKKKHVHGHGHGSIAHESTRASHGAHTAGKIGEHAESTPNFLRPNGFNAPNTNHSSPKSTRTVGVNHMTFAPEHATAHTAHEVTTSPHPMRYRSPFRDAT